MLRKIMPLVLLTLLISACGGSEENNLDQNENLNAKTDWSIELEELFDKDYPNNPDISIRHSLYTQIEYGDVNLQRLDNGTFDIIVNPIDEKDTVALRGIDLLELMPTICNKIKGNEYLEKIAVINQEWNRHQVKFLEGEFDVTGENSQGIKRVDIARNCLNSYLWEIIFYAEEDSILKPYYHGWFDFPHELYADLFQERNDVEFSTYEKSLVDWVDPEHEAIDLSKLRSVSTEVNASFTNLNHEEYPLAGERKKKQMNIMYPKNTTVMQDFLTDSTVFATFSPPGFYNQEDPRKTELSRLSKLHSVYVRKLESDLFELELRFNLGTPSKTTNFIVSGLNREEIPTLNASEVNNGWQNSMGFGNHTFYESYTDALNRSSKTSEYFAYLSDVDGLWIDSHHVGIDGPMMHWDSDNPNLLHFWILSFERHAFVGHYIIDCTNLTL
ncbi:MAG: hypothetical protein ABJG68_11915 [Crocinitomicaceae bacterium]